MASGRDTNTATRFDIAGEMNQLSPTFNHGLQVNCDRTELYSFISSRMVVTRGPK